MSKLLLAGIHRYLHNMLLWLAIAATIILSSSSALRIRDSGLIDDFYPLCMWIAMMILITLMIGTQFTDGLFRNKVIIGYTKSQIFLSEVLLAVGVTILLFVFSALTYLIIFPKAVNTFPGMLLLQVIGGMLLFAIGNSVFCVFLTTVFSYKGIASIISILLLFGFYSVGSELCDALQQDEYYESFYFAEETGELIADETIKYPNPNYIPPGPKRSIYQFWVNLTPVTQLDRMMEILYNRVYCYYFSLTPDTSEDTFHFLETSSYYAITFIVIFTSAGYFIFHKKELN